jgi:hypothetical protein
MTQCDRILRHLKDHGTITQAQAMQEYGCLRLAARISDLKNRGHRITVRTGRGKNRYGETTCFAVYSLCREGDTK